MKAFRYITLCAVSLVLFSCGENLEAYKEKVIEKAAKKLKTTEELLVKDLDLIIDSMTVEDFCVKDSLLLSVEIKNNRSQLLQGKIESFQKKIEENKENIKKASGFYANFTRVTNESLIKDYENGIKKFEKEIAKVKNENDSILNKYDGRNNKDVLLKIFKYRIAYKVPFKGIHEVKTVFSLFTPDGQTYLSDANEQMKRYLKSKNKK